MKLINISNKDRVVHLFCRDDQGNQKVMVDNNYYPHYYEPDGDGQFLSYDGIKLRKIVCSSPADIVKQRSSLSYASDIKYSVMYMINRVKQIEPCPIKCFYIDIEVLIPKSNRKTIEALKIEAPYPISSITIYNSFSKEYKNFFLLDYQGDTKLREKQLIDDVLKYFKAEKPDLWLSWNVEFDYCYMHNRIKDFAKRISPISLSRMGNRNYGERIFFPAGISIVDQMGLFQKLTINKRRSYKLDYIAQVDLGEECWQKTDFSNLKDGVVKYKNINDVKRMVKLEEKFNIIPYFNEIRILSKCQWEDLPFEIIRRDGMFIPQSNNSKIIDSLVLQKAKEKNIVVPQKRDNGEKLEYQGAFRESDYVGRFKDLIKVDVSGAYPNMAVSFCLDSVNAVEEPSEDTITIPIVDRITKAVNNTYHFKQNPDALLPSVIHELLVIKDKLKKEVGEAEHGSPKAKELKTKYNAIKGIVNSAYGVMGNRFFRLYDNRVAEAITFLVRDMLEYVKSRLGDIGAKVIYIDTDSFFIDCKEDITDKLNEFVQEWAIKKYNNHKVNIKFDYEGIFTKILITSKCHYFGYIKNKKGEIEKEIKGMEIVRSSTSKFEAQFQEKLIDKLLDNVERKEILGWIDSEKERIKTLPIVQIGFPTKIPMGKLENYPIHVRAYDNSRMIDKTFPELFMGDLFYYIFMIPIGNSDINGQPMNVLAFTDEYSDLIPSSRIDWNEIIKRSIDNKSDKLFEAIGWKSKGLPMPISTLDDIF